MTCDKARFETENGVRLTSIPKFYTSTLAGGEQSDSEDEDDDEQFLTLMNAEIETTQVRNKVPEENIQMRKELGGNLIDFGENCWRKVPAAIKRGVHVIGKMATGMIFYCYKYD